MLIIAIWAGIVNVGFSNKENALAQAIEAKDDDGESGILFDWGVPWRTISEG